MPHLHLAHGLPRPSEEQPAAQPATWPHRVSPSSSRVVSSPFLGSWSQSTHLSFSAGTRFWSLVSTEPGSLMGRKQVSGGSQSRRSRKPTGCVICEWVISCHAEEACRPWEHCFDGVSSWEVSWGPRRALRQGEECMSGCPGGVAQAMGCLGMS